MELADKVYEVEKQNIELKAEVARLVGEVTAWSDNFLEEQKECHAAVLERDRLRALLAVKDAALGLIKVQNYSAPSKCGMCKRILTVGGEVTAWNVRHCGWCPIPQVEQALEAK